MSRSYFRMRELATAQGRAGHLPVSPATIWRWVAAGEFPAPVKLSGGVTAWPAEAIKAWERERAESAARG